MSAVKKFEHLQCWKKARESCNQISELYESTSLKQDFALKDQILRSNGSVMDNIAEGFGRGGNKEFIQFLFYAKGSYLEVMSQLYRVLNRKYISENEFQNVYAMCNEVSKMLTSLIYYLRNTDKKEFKHNELKK